METKDFINIATDFSDHPGSRYKKDGEWSGEQFLEDILLPKFEKAVNDGYILEIDLNRVYGYPSSFVSGSFGKLSLKHGAELVLKHIVFKSEDNPLNTEKIHKEITNPKREEI